jgi:anthranilate synthase component 1
MKFEKFEELSRNYNRIPVYEKITADLLTPVTAFIKLREKDNFCFLFESVEGIGNLARYSFIGKNPTKVISNNGLELNVANKSKNKSTSANIFEILQSEISDVKFPVINELPDFTGGIVGYLGFENISLIENVIEFSGEDKTLNPDSQFGIFDTIIAFDHYKHQIILITNLQIDKFDSLQEAFTSGKEELEMIRKELSAPFEYKSDFKLLQNEDAEIDKAGFFEMVNSAKKNIYEGDVFQLVLSKRFSSKYNGDLLNVYRSLRIINPSPYMYYIQLNNDFTIIGTSPEDLVKVKNNKATILPIAGTRRRGRSEQEDMELEIELLNDPKEIAEHQMLVDLARNDLGRVCKYDTVKVIEDKTIHRFSHVMHIVSRVEGELEEGQSCIDALKASFPAGTVSGAPKIRAIQLINEYEKLKRNVYAGAIGYVDYCGNMDMCIAIRTLFADKDKIMWQAGAGIVADSKPELELKEIKNKSAVLESALQFAEVIDENIDHR